MPAKKTNAKTFYATRRISHGVDSFEPGDVVPEGPTLRELLVFGDSFVTDTAPARKGKSNPDAETVVTDKENTQ